MATGTIKANASKADIESKADVVYLTSSDTTWANIWAKISALRSGYAAPIYINSASISALTGGTRTSGAFTGLITKGSSSTYYLFCRQANAAGTTFQGTITNASSTSSGDYSETVIPRFKNLGAAEGANSYTVTNNSRIVIDLVTGNEGRMGHINLYVSASGVLTYRTDLGSNVTISKSTNTLNLSFSGGGSSLFCTIWSGDITRDT